MSLPNSVLPFSEYYDSRQYYQVSQMAFYEFRRKILKHVLDFKIIKKKNNTMSRNIIKLGAAYGPDKQQIVVKRNQDLIVLDLMEDIQKQFRIPIEEQLIFHKGKNISNFSYETLEKLGVENLDHIKVLRDAELPNRSPRNYEQPAQANYFNPSVKRKYPTSYASQMQ